MQILSWHEAGSGKKPVLLSKMSMEFCVKPRTLLCFNYLWSKKTWKDYPRKQMITAMCLWIEMTMRVFSFNSQSSFWTTFEGHTHSWKPQLLLWNSYDIFWRRVRSGAGVGKASGLFAWPFHNWTCCLRIQVGRFNSTLSVLLILFQIKICFMEWIEGKMVMRQLDRGEGKTKYESILKGLQKAQIVNLNLTKTFRDWWSSARCVNLRDYCVNWSQFFARGFSQCKVSALA
jgi:hypothetical protein